MEEKKFSYTPALSGTKWRERHPCRHEPRVYPALKKEQEIQESRKLDATSSEGFFLFAARGRETLFILSGITKRNGNAK